MASSFPVLDPVRDFNADPSGTNDSTRNFRACLDAASSGDIKFVLVPKGFFRFDSGNIVIPEGVTVQGSYNSPVDHGTTDGNFPPAADGTVFLVRYTGDQLQKAFYQMDSNSSLRGISFWWPYQNNIDAPPKPYPFAIGKATPDDRVATNISISDIELLNCFQGIDLTLCWRHNVRNVIGQAFSTGILIDQVRDVGRIENVHFHALWSGVQFSGQSDQKIVGPQILLYQFNYGTAFKILHSDAQMVRNCFVYVYNKGLWLASPFPQQPVEGAYGSFEGMSFDSCATALYLDGANVPGVQFTNTTILGARVLGINITRNFASTVKFTNGCNGNGFGLGVLVNGGNVIFTNFQFADNDERHASLVADAINPSIHALSLLVQGCTFTKTLPALTSFPLHVDVRGSVGKALLIGNMFPGTSPQISNLAQVAVTSLNA
jgi:hypothetical protein